MSSRQLIRNFSIIAHVDHGKSTLADRLIQLCGGLDEREMDDQVLDSMDLERERGITIKSQSASLSYASRNGSTYQLNLIDTPGHVDFSYEVSRSLAASDAALLVVDAVQGVEAQSVANCYTAIEQGLEILPVMNKIDLPQAEPERVAREIEEFIGLETTHALAVSAKTGAGVEELLERIVRHVRPPGGSEDAPLRALIFDSWFDNYLGVVSMVRVFAGTLGKGDRIVVHSVGRETEVNEVGVFTPRPEVRRALSTGEVGYLVTGVKDIRAAPVGDTVMHAKRRCKPLPGFESARPQVYAGIFPVSSDQFEGLRTAIEKLCLNDAALQFEPETSDSLGFGFRCGFLGLLHMEIVQERLEREYGLNLITSAPSVVYEVVLKSGESKRIENPSEFPDPSNLEEIREPIASVSILVPPDHVGGVLALAEERRGVQKNMQFSTGQVALTYEIPLSEVVMDFFDRLKSVSRGYASLDYGFHHFEAADLVRLDVLINGEPLDSLACIVHRSEAFRRGQALTRNMKRVVPRQLFDVAIQAAIGRQVIARQTVKALRKNVTAKCYGGDVTRKRKLLEKQKEGKKRMKQFGRVEIPQEAFLSVLSRPA